MVQSTEMADTYGQGDEIKLLVLDILNQCICYQFHLSGHFDLQIGSHWCMAVGMCNCLLCELQCHLRFPM